MTEDDRKLCEKCGGWGVDSVTAFACPTCATVKKTLTVEPAICPKCERLGGDCGEHLPEWSQLVAYWRDKAIAAEARNAKLVECLENLIDRSEAVRVLAAEQASKMPSKIMWLEDMDRFYAAQTEARAALGEQHG